MTDTLAYKNPSGDIVARSDFGYRWRVYALSGLLIVFGLWCVRDGFFRWPQTNARNEEIIKAGHTPAESSHSQTDIRLNQALGVGLPGLGLLSLLLRVYRSRGAYVLSNDTLSVPGHPPVPLDNIESIDKTHWDRKGVAIVEYTTPGGSRRILKLEDMIYDRKATDDIVERLERHLNPAAAAVPIPDDPARE